MDTTIGNYIENPAELDQFVNSTLESELARINLNIIPADTQISNKMDIILTAHKFKDMLVESVYFNNLATLSERELNGDGIDVVNKQHCIYCYTLTKNIVNVCGCKLESCCITCFLKRNNPAYTNISIPPAAILHSNHITSGLHMIKHIKSTVICKVCKNQEPLEKLLKNHYKLVSSGIITDRGYKVLKHIKELDFYNIENKSVVDIIDDMVKGTQISEISDYGFGVYLKAPDCISIKIKQDYVKKFLNPSPRLQPTFNRIPMHLYCKPSKIKLSLSCITQTIFYAIYFKCLEHGSILIKEKAPAHKIIHCWNKFCWKLNKIIKIYYPAETNNTKLDFHVQSVFIMEINSIHIK